MQDDPNDNHADDQRGGGSEQVARQHPVPFRREVTERLNYLCVEHWFTSGGYIFAIGFIAFAIQAYFSTVTPFRWLVYGGTIISAYIAIAIINVAIKLHHSNQTMIRLSEESSKRSSAIGAIVSEYVAVIDWLEAGSKASVNSVRLIGLRCPEFFLDVPMKPGAATNALTVVREAARKAGVSADWKRINAQLKSDPELMEAMRSWRDFMEASTVAGQKIIDLGSALACSAPPQNVSAILDLEHAIVSGKTGDDLWNAIAAARKQAKQIQYGG